MTPQRGGGGGCFSTLPRANIYPGGRGENTHHTHMKHAQDLRAAVEEGEEGGGGREEGGGGGRGEGGVGGGGEHVGMLSKV